MGHSQRLAGNGDPCASSILFDNTRLYGVRVGYPAVHIFGDLPQQKTP
jgi:hypothetical protein